MHSRGWNQSKVFTACKSMDLVNSVLSSYGLRDWKQALTRKKYLFCINYLIYQLCLDYLLRYLFFRFRCWCILHNQFTKPPLSRLFWLALHVDLVLPFFRCIIYVLLVGTLCCDFSWISCLGCSILGWSWIIDATWKAGSLLKL